MDTAAIIVALLTGIAALVTAISTSRHAATKDQVEALCKIIDQLQDEDTRKQNLIQRLQRRVQQLVSELMRHGIRVPDEEA